MNGPVLTFLGRLEAKDCLLVVIAASLLGALIWRRIRTLPVVPSVVMAGLAAALVTVTILEYGGSITNIETHLFGIFSFLLLSAAGLTVIQRNPAYASLCFAFVVLNAAGLFVLLAAPFLMAVTIIVYAGAIIVTFMFVIMLSQQSGLSEQDNRVYEPFMAALCGLLTLTIVAILINQTFHSRTLAGLVADAQTTAESKVPTGLLANLAEVDVEIQRLRGSTDAVGQLERTLNENRIKIRPQNDAAVIEQGATAIAASGNVVLEKLGRVGTNHTVTVSPYAAGNLTAKGKPALPAANVAALGRALYADYLLAVELAGVLLLVATIGAIAIANRRTGTTA